MKQYFIHFFYFVYYEALSCAFPVFIFLTLALSHLIPHVIIPRYDFVLILCILFQIFLLYFHLETKQEFLMSLLFHGIGLELELFKVHMGSWSYPEDAYTKIAGVPLYSGFMYASVASYIIHAWNRFHLRLFYMPSFFLSTILCSAIYLNFFTHHFMYDFRWVLVGLLVIVYRKTIVIFTIKEQTYNMSAMLSLVLISLFIWFAENISTFLGAWKYPNQMTSWALVHIGKINSWFLLVMISFIIVSFFKQRSSIQHA